MLHKLDKHSQEQAEGQKTTTQLERLKHDSQLAGLVAEALAAPATAHKAKELAMALPGPDRLW